MSTSVALVGKPDGPMKFVPEFGCETGTFTQMPDGEDKLHLMHHVPLHKRGYFRPEQLANYDPAKKYRVNDSGYVLCYFKLDKNGKQKRCGVKALNLSSRCVHHGGALHPFDKRKTKNDFEERSKDELREQLSRREQFERKLITVEDLDDEEIAMQGFRDRRGNVVPLKVVPRELSQAFVRAVYDRANKKLRSYTVKSVETLGDLATDKTVDPAIRLRAAQDIIDRNLGKAPQSVAITVSTPYEEIFDAIGGISRAESRRLRQGEIESASVGSDINGDNRFDGNGSDRNGEPLDVDIVDIDSNSDSGDMVHLSDNVNKSDDVSETNIQDDVSETNIQDNRLSSRNPAILAQSWELPTKLVNVPTTEDL